MAIINRRRLLGLGLGAGSMLSAPRGLRAQEQGPYRSNRSSPPLSYVDVRGQRQRVNPVTFWNDACLELVALDHSIDAADSRAPGPCAAARALGLMHIVMADAVAAVFPVNFEGYYVRGVRFGPMQYPEAFVGGACARMLEHIYNTPAHSQLIGLQRQRFLGLFDRGALEAWNAGLSFARADAFVGSWNWQEVKDAVTTSSRKYWPRPGEHDVDPYNPDQKFYGVDWGHLKPLAAPLRFAAVAPPPPPGEHDREFIHDAEEVMEIGAWRPDAPTRDQVQIGLFWTYCGDRLIGTPNRLYNQIVRQIVERDGMSVPEMARTLALCNIALADAGLVAWESKYRHRVWRPVLALPRLYPESARNWRPFGSPRTNPMQFSLGSDTQFRLTALSMMGGGERVFTSKVAQNILPYEDACFTPNFPSYPSGHSTFGTACFNVLKLVRAERDATRRDPGRLDGMEFVSDELNGTSIDNFRNQPRPYLPISPRHIDEMIDDNNKSRVHIGVHWNFDCKYGSESGARIGEVVYRDAYRTTGGPSFQSR